MYTGVFTIKTLVVEATKITPVTKVIRIIQVVQTTKVPLEITITRLLEVTTTITTRLLEVTTIIVTRLLMIMISQILAEIPS